MQEVKLKFDRTNDYRIKEAFKTLRSNIEFCGDDVRIIAVTSCTPNEGKSSAAMEMARAFAEAGHRTILLEEVSLMRPLWQSSATARFWL